VADLNIGEVSWERMIRAVEKVRDRLRQATAALERAGVPYAIVGGNAVAAWVARVDEGAVRNTPNVDVLLNRVDLEAAKVALSRSAFIYAYAEGRDAFLDTPEARVRDSVRVVYAGEQVKPDDLLPAPDVHDSEVVDGTRVVRLEALVGMKLTSYRRIDRVHLRDMLEVGLVDETWPDRFPAPLAERLRTLLADPEG
jgi:hypothetical protein